MPDHAANAPTCLAQQTEATLAGRQACTIPATMLLETTSAKKDLEIFLLETFRDHKMLQETISVQNGPQTLVAVNII